MAVAFVSLFEVVVLLWAPRALSACSIDRSTELMQRRAPDNSVQPPDSRGAVHVYCTEMGPYFTAIASCECQQGF